MSEEAFICYLDDYNWETRPGRTDGARWKLLIDSDRTPSNGFSLGIHEFPPGTVLAPHRHAPQEIYWIKAGQGDLRIGDETQPVEPGTDRLHPGKPRPRHREHRRRTPDSRVHLHPIQTAGL